MFVALAAAALAGCGGDGGPPSGAAGGSTEPGDRAAFPADAAWGDDGPALSDAGGRAEGGASTPDAAFPTDAAPGSEIPPRADAGGGAPSDGGRLRTTIRIHYPTQGHTLSIRGASPPLTWTSGQVATEMVDGWSWVSDALATASDFKPLLDGTTWSLGANYRVVAGETAGIYPRFRQASGSYAVRWPTFASSLLGRSRKVWVYLPPGYDENTVARYPVVYMHDGQNLFDRQATFGCWLADEALDEGAATGSIREAIVVGPEATGARLTDYTPSYDATRRDGGGADAYLRSLVTELKPLVDRELRTLQGREHTTMVGSSLGGLVSVYAGVRESQTFGQVGALSPSTWWDGRMILGQVSSLPSAASRPLRVYVDSGNAGASLDDSINTTELAARFRSVGYQDTRDFLYVLANGHEHSEAYWSRRLPGALRFLIGPRPHLGSLP